MIINENKIAEILSSNGFVEIRNYAFFIVSNNTYDNSFKVACVFYNNNDYRIQELGVFIYGYLGDKLSLKILKEEVSLNPSWEVQEVLAMAFNSYCNINGYKKSLIIIKEWLNYSARTRRAVIEGLRIWTNKPYFNNNPNIAITLIAKYNNDKDNYVRKSVGNSLKDISRKYPDLIRNEIKSWDLSVKNINETYKLASKNLK